MGGGSSAAGREPAFASLANGATFLLTVGIRSGASHQRRGLLTAQQEHQRRNRDSDGHPTALALARRRRLFDLSLPQAFARSPFFVKAPADCTNRWIASSYPIRATARKTDKSARKTWSGNLAKFPLSSALTKSVRDLSELIRLSGDLSLPRSSPRRSRQPARHLYPTVDTFGRALHAPRVESQACGTSPRQLQTAASQAARWRRHARRIPPTPPSRPADHLLHAHQGFFTQLKPRQVRCGIELVSLSGASAGTRRWHSSIDLDRLGILPEVCVGFGMSPSIRIGSRKGFLSQLLSSSPVRHRCA